MLKIATGVAVCGICIYIYARRDDARKSGTKQTANAGDDGAMWKHINGPPRAHNV